MDGKRREVKCREMADDKCRLGLPLQAVTGIDQYLRTEWGIVPPTNPAVWDKQLARIAGTDLHSRFRYLHDKQASYLLRGKEPPRETVARFYDLISDDRISGFIHSQKRAYILDAAALLVYLIPQLEIAGPVLDVGCHIGYHAILIGRQTGREVVGIDKSVVAIQVAKRKTPPSLNVRFDTTPLKTDTLKERFDFVYAVDSTIPTGDNLVALSQVLRPNGVLILAHAFDAFADSSFARNLLAAGLGFGFADVTGGWIGEGRGFSDTTVVVLIKGTNTPLPQDFRQEIEQGWNFFKEYANDPTTPWDEKTQAFFRGKYIDSHPVPYPEAVERQP
jgi:2-polyprenyl-3-methyl-5-hydroxy-6-metoxy-1,4-benzoquinol methylase